MRALALAFLLASTAFQDKPAEPDANAQKETLKQIKELFKEEYAKKSPGDQTALAQKLLQKGIETNDDLPSKFVLLKEAREVAVAAGDADTAMRAAGETARAFAVDGPSLKLAVVTKMATATRDPETARTLAKSCVALVTEAVRVDGYETATSAATKGEQLARLAHDALLAQRLQDLKKEVGSLKDEHVRVKPMLEKPGSGDGDAVGRYLCFVKGDWDAGLPHLVAGAKGPLKALVDKDVLNPAEAAPQVEVAEGWADLAQKEKSPWRKSRLQARVRHWLEKAQPNATGVLKLKIEKRLGEIEESEPGTINLLRMVDPKVDAVGGTWSLDNGVLVSGTEEWARCQMPYTPPDEYDLTVVVERREGGDALGFCLGQGKAVFGLWVDGFPAKGFMSGLDRLDGSLLDNSPAAVKGKQLTNSKPSTILIAVRKSGVSVTIDGKSVLAWQGNTNRLTQSPVWQPRDPKAPILVGAFGTRYFFSKVQLTPVTGQGKKLR
ncbi:MAG: hypothetical protein EHM91_07705 [Planctomycetota bacterium]|nr:MAG: hypothetical protein EHM91_07705 [Planctomycetota bacterium]